MEKIKYIGDNPCRVQNTTKTVKKKVSLLQILKKQGIVKEMNIVLFSKADNLFFPLHDERAKHILTVLKKQKGDTFDAGIENGDAGIATITTIDNNGISFTFSATSNGKPLFPIEMIVGFVRPIQLKRLFRDVASLGVKKLHLVGTELGEKSYMHSKVVERGTAYNALRDGSIQAKSTHITELVVHNSVQECLHSIDLNSNNVRICLDNIQPQISLFEHLQEKNATEKTIYAAIGSERGWSEKERILFKDSNFTLCSMGQRVLRTETATTVALSIMLQSMGEMK